MNFCLDVLMDCSMRWWSNFSFVHQIYNSNTMWVFSFLPLLSHSLSYPHHFQILFVASATVLRSLGLSLTIKTPWMQSNPEILFDHRKVNVQDVKTEIVVLEQIVGKEKKEQRGKILAFGFFLVVYLQYCPISMYTVFSQGVKKFLCWQLCFVGKACLFIVMISDCILSSGFCGTIYVLQWCCLELQWSTLELRFVMISNCSLSGWCEDAMW